MNSKIAVFSVAVLFIVSFFAFGGILTPFIEEKITVTPGEKYLVGSGSERALRVKNTGKETVEVNFEVSRPRQSDKKEGYSPLPDISWVNLETRTVEVEPGMWGETRITVLIPKEKENYGRNFEAALVSAASKGRGTVEAALRSRLLIETENRKSFWKRLRDIFRRN